jgi:hypothetical protein
MRSSTHTTDSTRVTSPFDWLRVKRHLRRVTPFERGKLRIALLLASLTATQSALSQSPDYCARQPARTVAHIADVATFAGANTALWIYFKRAWWSGDRADKFFYHADWDQEFRDQDKFGHLYGGYHLTRAGHSVLRLGCVSEPAALTIAAVHAAVFQLQIEIWDGFYKKYGFSYPDLLANTIGMGYAVLQEYHPKLKAIKPTLSYSPTAIMRSPKEVRGEIRTSLDYSGQTYWMSADVKELLPTSLAERWPAFIRLSLGHTITDWADPTTGSVHRAQRKLLLSLDFEPEALPGNAAWWKTIKRQLSYYHFPAPALQITPTVKGITWYR